MKRVINSLPEYDFVMHHQPGPDEHAVLLRRDGSYSVCSMQPRRLIAISPNYLADGNGILSGPLNRYGLQDLLQWTNYEEATNRFRVLADLPTNVVSLLSERRPPG